MKKFAVLVLFVFLACDSGPTIQQKVRLDSYPNRVYHIYTEIWTRRGSSFQLDYSERVYDVAFSKVDSVKKAEWIKAEKELVKIKKHYAVGAKL